MIPALKVPHLTQFKEWFQDYPRFSMLFLSNIREQHLNFVFAHLTYEPYFTILVAVSSAQFWAFEWAKTYQSIFFAREAFKTLGSV